ncbi:hypothetical protein B0187_08365 [Haemophilus paracuniculus]|uniref:Probable peptidoglycan glycosyltransferase FtsW n=1 Tax=Haemophilus paracuniculus TaxID=734 RepID=A0A1T0AQJ9_9PAST|nr:putative peptidoglycan glycosyltransferase FtsW [Haemophilus paracuniculus]OOR98450.1 hypothetical protein B0187_08365 [Haemophilus paracuniculus]
MWENIKQKWAVWTEITPPNALYDRTLLWGYFLLLTVGIIAVTSASVDITKASELGLISKQAIFAFISISVVMLSSQIPIWIMENKKTVFLVLFGTLILLFLTVMIGKKVNGAIRWIQLGPINFQASEFAKLAIISYLASYCSRQYERIHLSPISALVPTVVIVAFLVAFNFQSDTGSIVISCALTMAMFLLAGMRKIQFVALSPVAIIGGIAYLSGADYRLGRLVGFLDPFGTYEQQGLQQSESLFALSSGGINGVGLGNSIGKLGNLPEQHTDFIMAIIGEEFGFLGLLVIVFLVLLISFRIFKIAYESFQLTERYKGYLAVGIGLWFFGQSFGNLGVVSSALPAKGLTFPFVSYGGSSLIAISIALGFVLRIDYENRLARIGSAKRKA